MRNCMQFCRYTGGPFQTRSRRRSAMAAQIDKVISELRDMVLSGALQPGERVVEPVSYTHLFVSMDDSEMLNQVQIGVTGYPEARGIVEMGGRDTEPADYMVTEVLIRSFYDYYRNAMGL